MADTPQTLDDLSDAQRKALTWLSNQQGTDPVDPPSEYRSNTWKALDGHGLVAYDHDAGTVSMRPAGRALFAEDDAPATAEAPADTANSGDPAPAQSADVGGGVGVVAQTGTGSPSAEQVAADDQPAPDAGTGSSDPAMAGTVEQPSGEDPNPAPSPRAADDAPPVHEQQVSRLGDLRAGNRLVDPRLGACRVLGEPEPLYGTQAGSYRVPVMVVENGRREYVRGTLDAEIEQD